MVDDVHMIIPPFLATSASYRQYPRRLIWVGPTRTATLFALPKHCFLVNMLGSIFFDLLVNACWESAPRCRLGVTTCNWARKKKKKNLPFKRSCCNAESVLFLTFMFIFKKKKKSRAEVTLHERSPCLIFDGKHDTEPSPRYTSKQQTKGARMRLLLTPPPRLAGFHGRDRCPLPPHRVMSLVSLRNQQKSERKCVSVCVVVHTHYVFPLVSPLQYELFIAVLEVNDFM